MRLSSPFFAVLLLVAAPCAATLTCPGGADTCMQDEASMLQMKMQYEDAEVNLHSQIEQEQDSTVAVSKDVHVHEELVPPPPEPFTFSNLIWNNTVAQMVQQEIELAERKPPEVDKVLYVLFTMFLGWCGCDRCFMGQTCCGIIKGFTFAGFGIWFLIDHFTCIYCALSQMEDIHMIGYHAKFYPSTVNTAFWVMIVLLAIELSQHFKQAKHHKEQMEEQAELLKQLDASLEVSSVCVPVHHQALAHLSTPLSKALRKVGVLDKDASIPELIAAFKAIDKDGDGKLDRDELKQALSSIGVSDEDVDAMIQEADTDGDGKISKGEFLRYHANRMSSKNLS